MKKFRVIIDTQAKLDLSDIFNFVHLHDSAEAAEFLLNKLEEACFRLEKLPQRGHVPEELRDTGIKRYLEVHFKPYRIIYEIKNSMIYIHSVLDGRRNIQEILNERILR